MNGQTNQKFYLEETLSSEASLQVLHENILNTYKVLKILKISYLQESVTIICMKQYRIKNQFNLQKIKNCFVDFIFKFNFIVP